MRKAIAKILAWQTRRLLAKWQPIVIVVAGSVGKTSTTQAIADMLSSTRRVRATRHNYNSDIGVPCSVFGHDIPDSLYNPFSWLWLIIKNEKQILREPVFNTLVLEIGTDKPGEIEEFAYLAPHVAVVTAVAPEHMEQFGTLEAVAREELSVTKFARETACNSQLVNKAFTSDMKVSWFDATILKKYQAKHKMLGSQGEQIAAAAVWVAERIGVGTIAIEAGLIKLGSQPGRMQVLAGIENSIIIDDTYNSSPDAVMAALNFIYTKSAPFRIALLGNMNELGDYSEQAHSQVGNACDPKKLRLVVTLGEHSNTYTAAAAEAKGCKVVRVATPYQAADVIRTELRRDPKKGALVLCKGSQNGVFAEEAVKLLLAHKSDRDKLVRQSKAWINKKTKSFKVQ